LEETKDDGDLVWKVLNNSNHKQIHWLRQDKAKKEGQWFCIHYADFCGGDASSEHCKSFEQAV